MLWLMQTRRTHRDKSKNLLLLLVKTLFILLEWYFRKEFCVVLV
jgi:hypothetical protein